MEAEQGDTKAISLDVLRQPIRVRILEICTEYDRISASEMVDLGLCSDIESLQGLTDRKALSNIAYHCRRLATFGFLTGVTEPGKRGARKRYYSANSKAIAHTKEWAQLTEPEREAISQVTWRRLISQVDGSMRQKVFDSRTDRWMAWGPLNLDREGWKELADKIEALFVDTDRIEIEAQSRMQLSGETPLTFTYALLGFESPQPVGRPRRKPGKRRANSNSQHRSRS
jgi:DNA-binding PadR family transcriptional regulator